MHHKYGYFSDDGSEFVITDPKTPRAFVGYNPRLFKLNPFWVFKKHKFVPRTRENMNNLR